jgi:hypothetical protein
MSLQPQEQERYGFHVVGVTSRKPRVPEETLCFCSHECEVKMPGRYRFPSLIARKENSEEKVAERCAGH